MTLVDLNSIPIQKFKTELSRCCGSSTWVNRMAVTRPFKNQEALYRWAEKIWYQCSPTDWLEAFSHHPKIGNLRYLEKKFAGTKEWAGSELQGMVAANVESIQKFARLNEEYEKRFGFIFIVCATGKTAAEMLTLLESRGRHTSEEEIKIAMEEQNKITKLRLQKLLS